MIPISIDSYAPTPSPEEGWQEAYERAWAKRYLEVSRRVDRGDFFNAFQAVRYVERELESKEDAPTSEVFTNGKPMLRLTSFRGNAFQIPAYARENAGEIIADYILRRGPFDAVVELGSGFGRNLFDAFYHSGWQGPYFGGEISPSGRKMGEKIATLADRMTVSFHPFDHLAPNLDFLGRRNRVLVVTVHSIEQVNLPDSYFDVLATAGQQTLGVHLEPVGFQISRLGPVSDMHAKMMEARGWNLNFASVLKAAGGRRAIEIDMIAPEVFTPGDPVNPTTLVSWHSSRQR